MKIFIDTADTEAIRLYNSYGILSGVTTNPSSIAKEGRDFKEIIAEILDIVDGVVFGEVISPQADRMVEEALELVKLSSRLEIIIPMCAEGLKAISALRREGVRTNCTLIFTAAQAVLAARAGASYVSVFVGRLGDTASCGAGLVGDIAKIFAAHGDSCQIIAADIRSPHHAAQCAKLGAHNAAIPPDVIGQMIAHPLTDAGIARFARDWEGLLERL
ncbi:MAG: fructose-6-phosphate aldolase [Oscillospiraceae bacterium]|nr:fructose-6-phosphate aldolase [Oscillospiraceae bacterium]